MIDWKLLRRELAVARIKAGLEEGALAKAIDVDVSTIYRIEKSASGKNNPNLEIIANWVKACGLSLSSFAALIDAPGSETAPFEVKLSAPAQQLVDRAILLTKESQVRAMPSPAAEHGQAGAVSGEIDLASLATDMRQATAALLLALKQTRTIAGTEVVDRSRKAAKARAARARKRAQPRKDRRRGAGAA